VGPRIAVAVTSADRGVGPPDLFADSLHPGTLTALFGRGPLKQFTKQTIGTIAQLARVCTQIRSQGFSSDDGELQEGVRCVAAPIRAESGVVIGSIGISAPAIRFPKDRYAIASDQVRAVAEDISARLRVQPQDA